MAKRLTTEEFIKRAKEVHGDRYDYSETIYVNGRIKVNIICKRHGDFTQRPDIHLNGSGCNKCAKNIPTSEKFIERAKEVHGDRYDYSKSIYNATNKKLVITCNTHGDFTQTPYKHIFGQGCPDCGVLSTIKKKSDKCDIINNFKEKASKKHNGKYDYSLVTVDSDLKLINIICPLHGEFEQNSYDHASGLGCKKCSGSIKHTKETFIKKSKQVHGNKYNYEKVKYANNKKEVIITCEIHGDFKQRPDTHLNGGKCYDCAIEDTRLTQYGFIKKCKETHGNLYDYDKINYHNTRSNVIVVCKIHGDFTINAHNHIKGSGCPDCKIISRGETLIKDKLKTNYIRYEQQKIFNNCLDKHHLRFDFYLPEQNICIEYDGVQHFKNVKIWGGEEGLKDRQRKDQIKNQYCKDNDIILLRIKYDENINDKMKFIIKKED